MTVREPIGKDHVSIRLLDRGFSGDEKDRLVVHEAWVVLQVWDGVDLTVERTRGLTTLERFAIECVLGLKACTADDLFEIAAVPTDFGAWVLERLQQAALLHRGEDGGYRPDPRRCESALEAGAVPVLKTTRVSLVWFVETGDILVVDGKVLRDLRHLRPEANAPVPPSSNTQTRQDVIQQAIHQGKFRGETGAVRAACAAEPVSGPSPAYACTARIRSYAGDDSHRTQLTIRGRTCMPRSTQPAKPGADIAEVHIPGEHCLGLSKQWEALCKRASRGRAQESDVSTVSLANLAWLDGGLVLNLAKESAARFAERMLLLPTMAIEVDSREQALVEAPVVVRASDEGAAWMIGRDAVVQRAAAHQGRLNATVLRELVEEAPVRIGIPEVRQRIWERRMFSRVYELREDEDFRE